MVNLIVILCFGGIAHSVLKHGKEGVSDSFDKIVRSLILFHAAIFYYYFSVYFMIR